MWSIDDVWGFRVGGGVHDSYTFQSVAYRRTRGPIDKISFGAPFWPVTNHSRSDSSLFEPGFEVDPSGPGRAALASPRARGSCHRGSPRCPRNTRLIMASVIHDNVYYPKQTLSMSLLSRLPVLGRDQCVNPPSIARK